ncbi:unnamed protein product [Soboliphyme baturini]|uniref:Uncharacterized protein n=1 Tax=Soboliphyme baturini TaxID=241478 RepID=A0A183IRE4_9BILA|nr:unnamed protein product [Soboliphyme baturini]
MLLLLDVPWNPLSLFYVSHVLAALDTSAVCYQIPTGYILIGLFSIAFKERLVGEDAMQLASPQLVVLKLKCNDAERACKLISLYVGGGGTKVKNLLSTICLAFERETVAACLSSDVESPFLENLVSILSVLTAQHLVVTSFADYTKRRFSNDLIRDKDLRLAPRFGHVYKWLRSHSSSEADESCDIFDYFSELFCLEAKPVSDSLLLIISSALPVHALCKKLYELSALRRRTFFMEEAVELLFELFTFDDVSGRCNRLMCSVRSLFDPQSLNCIEENVPNDYTCIWRTRIRAAAALLKMFKLSAQVVEDILKQFLRTLNELIESKKMIKLYPNSPLHIRFTRFLQLALIFQPYIHLDETARQFLAICCIFFEMAAQPSVTILAEWISSRICVQFPSILDYWLEIEYEVR